MGIVENCDEMGSSCDHIQIGEVRFAVVDISWDRYAAKDIPSIRRNERKGMGVGPVLFGVQSEVSGSESATHKRIKQNASFLLKGC